MRILFALDDCQASAQTALSLAKRLQAELTVLFVLDATWNVYVGHDWLSGSNSRADFLDWIKQEEQQAASVSFENFRQLAGDFQYQEVSVAGDVSEEILKEAHTGYDLLILTNPFTRGLEIVRNTVAKVTAAKPCAVLLLGKDKPLPL